MALAITHIEAVAFNLPFAQVFEHWRIAGRTPDSAAAGYVLVRVHTNEGIVGLGEAGRFYEGESQFSVAHAVDRLFGPYVRGLDPLNRLAVHRKMERVAAGHSYAKAAIDVALFDIAGKVYGVPSCIVLGGRLRDSVRVTARVGAAESAMDVCDRAIAAAEQGYTCVKLKIGEDVDRDLRVLQNVRETVGHHMSIRLDANQGYSRAHIPALLRMDEFVPLVIEQPLPAEDVAGMRELAHLLVTPVMADEAATSPQRIRDLVGLGPGLS